MLKEDSLYQEETQSELSEERIQWIVRRIDSFLQFRAIPRQCGLAHEALDDQGKLLPICALNDTKLGCAHNSVMWQLYNIAKEGQYSELAADIQKISTSIHVLDGLAATNARNFDAARAMQIREQHAKKIDDLYAITELIREKLMQRLSA